MFTQVITPTKNPVSIELPEEYIGHRIRITAEETISQSVYAADREQYSFENWMKFIEAHPADLSDFKFDREEANER